MKVAREQLARAVQSVLDNALEEGEAEVFIRTYLPFSQSEKRSVLGVFSAKFACLLQRIAQNKEEGMGQMTQSRTMATMANPFSSLFSSSIELLSTTLAIEFDEADCCDFIRAKCRVLSVQVNNFLPDVRRK